MKTMATGRGILIYPKPINGPNGIQTLGDSEGQGSLACWGFPGGSDGKESAHNTGDLGLILGLERSAGEGNGYPLQYSGLENPMDCTVHGDAKIVYS